VWIAGGVQRQFALWDGPAELGKRRGLKHTLRCFSIIYSHPV
jgi:hypothetical protein